MTVISVLNNLRWRQIIAAASASYILICVGMSLVWTSPVLRMLKGPHSPLARPPTPQEEEWIGSLLMLGGTFGPIVTVPLTRFTGRRPILMAVNVPMILGWILAGIASNVYYMYAARFLWGCTLGIAFMVVPIYIGEISDDNNRGTLGALFTLCLYTGFFLAFLVGRFASYVGLAVAGGLISMVYLGLSWSLPETPFYLVLKGHTAEASVVLQKLRNASPDQVSMEVKGLEQTVELEYREDFKLGDLWSTRGTQKALGICVFMYMMIQLSGINVILFYLEDLFAKFKVKMAPSDAPIVIGAVQVVAVSIMVPFIERLSRRFLLCTTFLGMFVVLTIMGVYTLVEFYYHIDVSSVSALPILLLIIYIILFTWGVGPVAPILVSEMFRPKVKYLACGLCSALCWFSGFILTRFYNDLTGAWGEYTGFWMMAVFCGVGAAFSFFLLINTRGKTFQEIQDALNDRH